MISTLYSTVAIVVALGYLPQTIKLLRCHTPCLDISLMAWGIWEYTAIVSLLYSLIELNDIKLSIVNAINVFFITLIIGITLYKRRKYTQVSLPTSDINDTLSDTSDIKKTMDKILENHPESTHKLTRI